MKGLEKSALTVGAVAFFISDLIKNQLGPVLIKGEVSNLQLRPHSSYLRFSLKDSSAKIDCLTHSSTNAAKLLQHIHDGDQVIIFAQPSYYSKYNQVSFFTDEMMKVGEGIFHTELEKLKQTLYEEGLFDESKKKSWPKYPEHVGVVTSADGAALQDILRVIEDRYPIVTVHVFPSLVQGKHAPLSLSKALTRALEFNPILDVIIVARGGGSHEDLEAFNDETLVRLIALSCIPIISAIGHEIDTTLSDYVSDFSAPTPTGAAMTIFPDKQEIIKELGMIRDLLTNNLKHKFNEEITAVSFLKQRLQTAYTKYMHIKKQELQMLKSQIDALNPLNTLKKGYSMILTPKIDIGETIEIQTATATIKATIHTIISKEFDHE